MRADWTFQGGAVFRSGGRLFFFRGAHPISAIFGTIDLDSLYFEVHIFLDPPTPPAPICLKMPKCAIFGTFWLCHFKNTPKVGVHREKFNIGKVAQIFFGGSYICWDYVISFSQHFPIKKFSPSPSPSPTPVFHPLFGI